MIGQMEIIAITYGFENFQKAQKYLVVLAVTALNTNFMTIGSVSSMGELKTLL